MDQGRDWSLVGPLRWHRLSAQRASGHLPSGRGMPMVHLEEWMEIRELHRLGVSQSEIARRLDLDRKTVHKYLRAPPETYGPRAARPATVDIHSLISYLLSLISYLLSLISYRACPVDWRMAENTGICVFERRKISQLSYRSARLGPANL